MLFKLPVSISISIAFHCDFIAWLVGWLHLFVFVWIRFMHPSRASWRNCISKSVCNRIVASKLQWFFTNICKMVVMTRFRLFVLLFLETISTPCAMCNALYSLCVQPRESSIDSPLYFENRFETLKTSMETMNRLDLRCHCAVYVTVCVCVCIVCLLCAQICATKYSIILYI